MVKRVTPSQFRSLMRQNVRKINQAIDKVNRANKQYVADVNSAIRKHNASVRKQRQEQRLAVAQYNRWVTSHNSRVRSNRASLASRATALQSRQTTKYISVKTTTVDLLHRFDRLAEAPQATEEYLQLVRLAEVESANSASVAETLLDESPPDAPMEEEPSGILTYLGDLSTDLLDRWKGAIFALNPVNTEASRHFCTSAREIFTEILEKWATDAEVLDADPQCHLTPNGKPTRRSKIKYLLGLKGADTPEMIGFVDADIENVIQLFNEFNEATHGVAGKFGFSRLQAMRRRVEGGIMFLATIAA
jgi:Predicted pPIWI-associating nuclease